MGVRQKLFTQSRLALLLICMTLFEPAASLPAPSMGTATAEVEIAPPPKAEQAFVKYCTGCHAVDRINSGRHSWPIWQFVVWRMRLMYGFKLDAETHQLVVAHLNTRYGADFPTAIVEWLIVVLFLGTPSLGIYLWRKRGKHLPLSSLQPGNNKKPD